MGPGQFATQCVAFSHLGKGQVELPEILQVGDGKPFAEFLAEGAGKIADEVGAVFRAGFASLFLLDDTATYVPVGVHHRGVGGGIGLAPGIAQDGPHIVEQA